ncbi:MAG: DUF948 domain-containing protein [Candidatus Poribacteria bacterium]|nr:DUF948 domain-containing protein [Candidatus Poribacteria bacterium]
MLFALSLLFVYLCAVLKSIRKNLRSIERLTYQEVGNLLQDVDQTVKTLNGELPQLLKNINEITASVHEISVSEIQPMTHSIQEMTETVNQNVAKMDELIDSITDFSQTTVKRAEFYRDQLSIPITDVISLWSGIKAGWEVFRQPRKSSTSDSEDAVPEEQSE